jgi:hypothetical protein
MQEDAYNIARRSIDVALRSRQESLSLSGNQLTALPPEIGQLTVRPWRSSH